MFVQYLRFSIDKQLIVGIVNILLDVVECQEDNEKTHNFKTDKANKIKENSVKIDIVKTFREHQSMQSTNLEFTLKNLD